MSDQPEKPVAPQPSNVPAGAAALEPPPSPVKILKDWLRAKTSSSKNKDVLKSVKSHQFVAPGGCRLNMAMLPNDVAVFTTKNDGDLIFNQTVGTKTSAKKQHFIAYTPLPDLGYPQGRWILGLIREPTTSRKRAASTRYAENWHNYTFQKALNGPNDWQDSVGTGRSINFIPGTSWCIVKLNVPVNDLDITISSPEGQSAPYVISPARVDLSTIDNEQNEPEETDFSISDIFGDPKDRDTSNSHHSSNSFTIGSQKMLQCLLTLNLMKSSYLTSYSARSPKLRK